MAHDTKPAQVTKEEIKVAHDNWVSFTKGATYATAGVILTLALLALFM